MATYVVPQVLVHQEFDAAVAVDARDLPAHITAPHGFLVRYDEPDELALGRLGFYEPDDDTHYGWPHFPSGAKLDADYVKVRVRDALLRYFEDLIGTDDTIRTVASKPNRLRAAALAFVSNGSSFPASDEFLDRGVKIGDIVKVRAVSGDDVFTKWTYVKDFAYESVPGSIGAATRDDNNPNTTTAASAFEQTDGPANCAVISATSHASFNGLPQGTPSLVYVVRITEGSVGGDFTTARLRISSASGLDDLDDVVPSAAGVPTAIGTLGLTATFNISNASGCSDDAEEAEVAQDDLIAGQEWEITVAQTWTRPTATSAGTYTGAKDTTYIVEVTEGGLYSSDTTPKITVSTTTGIDVSGPTLIPATASAVAIGTLGATISFNSTGLNKGDKYYVEVVGVSNGRASTLILGHNLDSAIPASTDVDLTLYIKKTIEVSHDRTGVPGIFNWELDDIAEEGITLNNGITAFEDSWTDGGELVALDVVSDSSQEYGVAYVEYRAWLCTLGGEIGAIDDIGEIDNLISGSLHPDNPLKYAVSKALANANGTPVKYTAVCDPSDVDSWTEVLEILDGDPGVYGLVPCTHDREVQELFKAHVLAQSSEEVKRWCECWLNLSSQPQASIVDATVSDDNEEILATITDDPDTTGTQYTKVLLTSNNAGLTALDVHVGDVLRFGYTTDGFGNATYSTAVVADVVNEDTLLLVDGPDAPINVASKIEIWRNLTATAQSEAIGASAGAFDCRRVMAVWPDRIEVGNDSVDGYYLCAALAGLASGVVPQQGLTNVPVGGFTSVNRTTKLFNRSQLNIMAAAGVWIVTQDKNGNIFTRHAVTTGATEDINEREEMVTRNFDSISYFWADKFAPYIGISNATPQMVSIIEAETLSGIQFLRQRYQTQRLGGQITDAALTDIRVSPVFRDRIVVDVNYVLPYPLNNLDVQQHVVVQL